MATDPVETDATLEEGKLEKEYKNFMTNARIGKLNIDIELVELADASNRPAAPLPERLPEPRKKGPLANKKLQDHGILVLLDHQHQETQQTGNQHQVLKFSRPRVSKVQDLGRCVFHYRHPHVFKAIKDSAKQQFRLESEPDGARVVLKGEPGFDDLPEHPDRESLPSKPFSPTQSAKNVPPKPLNRQPFMLGNSLSVLSRSGSASGLSQETIKGRPVRTPEELTVDPVPADMIVVDVDARNRQKTATADPDFQVQRSDPVGLDAVDEEDDVMMLADDTVTPSQAHIDDAGEPADSAPKALSADSDMDVDSPELLDDYDEENDPYQRLLDEIKQQLDEEEQAKAEAERQMEKARQQLEELREARQNIERESEAFENKIAVEEDAVRKAEQSNTQQKSRLQMIKERNQPTIQALCEETVELQQELEQIGDKAVADMRMERDDLKSKLEERRAREQGLISEKAHLEMQLTNLDKQKMASLEADVKDLSTKVEADQTYLDRVNKAINVQRSEFRACRGDITKAEKEYEEGKGPLRALLKTRKDKTKQLQDQKDERSKVRKENDRLRSEIEVSEKRLGQDKLERTKLRDKKSKLDSEMQDVQNEVKKVNAEIATTKLAREQNKKKLEELQAQFDFLDNRKRKERGQLEEISNARMNKKPRLAGSFTPGQ